MQDDRSKVEDATIIDVEPQLIDEPAQAPKRKGFAGRMSLALLLAGLSAGGGAWLYRDVLAHYFPNDETAALVARLDALETQQKDAETRISAVIELTDELKSKLGAAEASAVQNSKLADKAMQSAQSVAVEFSGLKDGFAKVQDQLKAMSSASGTSSDNSALVARIAQLEQSIAQNAAPIVAKSDPAQAIVTLKAKIHSGAAINTEWDLLQALPENFSGLATVLGAKGTQVLTVTELTEALNKIGTPVPVVASTDEQGWLSYLSNLLGGLVTIENSAATPGDVALAKAKAFMASGDLGQAVASLEEPGLALPQEVQSWRTKAASRLNLDKAVADLTAAVEAQK